jgi:hypothetical protein
MFEGETFAVPEPTNSEPTIIVREPDFPRIAAASRAVVTELTRARPSGQWATEHLAPMLASRAINADDDHGRASEMVVQADGLRGPELLTFAELVAPTLNFEHHMTTNAVHANCDQCTAIQAHRRIASYNRYRTVGPNTPRSGGPPMK